MLRILLAEDNLGDIVLVRQALEAHHILYELYIVEDGSKALEFIARMGKAGESPCPDIVLLDLNLPKVDGPRVLDEFRKCPEGANTPVIVITSSGAQRDRARMAELGVAHYFKKPSDLDAFLQLGAVVRKVIEGGPALRQ